MKLKKIVLAFVAAGMGAAVAPVAFAASDAERITQLEKQVKDLRDQMESSVKENVVVGDIPGSLRIPGAESSVRMYGVAEINMVREMKGDNRGSDYSTWLPAVPLNGTPGAAMNGATYMHARTSRIGIEGSSPTPYGQAMVKVEGDFNNDPKNGDGGIYTSNNAQAWTNSYQFRLRHAYLQLGPWMAGQNWSTFMDIDNTPETVDFNGPIGGTFIRQPQIRYTYTTPTTGNFIAALENSVSFILDNTGTQIRDSFSTAPDLVLRWDRPATWGSIGVRAVSLEHRLNNGTTTDVARRGTGLAASGQIKTVGEDFFSWIVTGGEGIGRYFNAGNGDGFDGTSIVLEKQVGVVLGYQRKFSDSLRMNFVYGTQRLQDGAYTDWVTANALEGVTNRKLQQFHIGAIWNPIKPVDLGVEYIYGRRETMDGQLGEMSRVNLLARYNLN